MATNRRPEYPKESQEGCRRPAETEEEWRELMESDDETFVRSLEDWETLCMYPRSHPLPGVSRELVDEFTDELVFRNGGLAGGSYAMLINDVTVRQLYDLWNLFGISDGLFKDHQGYRCDGKHNCESTRLDVICMSTC